MNLNYKNLRLLLIFGLILCLKPLSLFAHPHVFIDVMAKFVLNDTALSGFYVYWEFDEMNSASMAEEFDKNRNFKFDKEECQLIEQRSLPYIAKNNYFVFFTYGTKALKIGKVEQFVPCFRMKSKIMYSFFVPFNFPISKLSDSEITLFFEDPSMFTAFQIKKDCIQVSDNQYFTGTIKFGKADYNECIILTIKRNAS